MKKQLTEAQRLKRREYAERYQQKNALEIKRRRQEKARLQKVRQRADIESRQIMAIAPEIDPRFKDFYSPCFGCRICNTDSGRAISCEKLNNYVMSKKN